MVCIWKKNLHSISLEEYVASLADYFLLIWGDKHSMRFRGTSDQWRNFQPCTENMLCHRWNNLPPIKVMYKKMEFI